jgi:phenylacetate-CoA ligase
MSDIYTRLVANALFPLQERLKKHDTVKVRQAMEESQWWPQQRILEQQAARLRDFLPTSAATSVLPRPVRPDRLRPAEGDRAGRLAGAALPHQVGDPREQDTLRADDAQGLARFNTGGSSGEPLIFFIGTERVTHDVAAKWRATRWWDVDIGDPEIVVWGSPIELGSRTRSA